MNKIIFSPSDTATFKDLPLMAEELADLCAPQSHVSDDPQAVQWTNNTLLFRGASGEYSNVWHAESPTQEKLVAEVVAAYLQAGYLHAYTLPTHAPISDQSEEHAQKKYLLTPNHVEVHSLNDQESSPANVPFKKAF